MTMHIITIMIIIMIIMIIVVGRVLRTIPALLHRRAEGVLG